MIQNPETLPLEQRLDIALRSQQLPIRGWVLEISADPIDKNSREGSVWPVYHTPPKTDPYGVILDPFHVEVLTYLPVNLVRFKATFRFTSDPIVIRGQVIRFAPEIVEKQIIQFYDQTGLMVIEFDPNPIKIYEVSRLIPNFTAFEAQVREWAEKKKRSENQSDIDRCRYILSQLAAIQQNIRQTIDQAMRELANTIGQIEPDYWGLIEKTMAGDITPQECMDRSNRTISIRLSDTYQAPSKVVH